MLNIVLLANEIASNDKVMARHDRGILMLKLSPYKFGEGDAINDTISCTGFASNVSAVLLLTVTETMRDNFSFPSVPTLLSL